MCQKWLKIAVSHWGKLAIEFHYREIFSALIEMVRNRVKNIENQHVTTFRWNKDFKGDFEGEDRPIYKINRNLLIHRNLRYKSLNFCNEKGQKMTKTELFGLLLLVSQIDRYNLLKDCNLIYLRTYYEKNINS